ncbi:FUSC family protein [Streptomyces sp. NPDC052043]|uniref:FUSC family protein n=1 Tax=Streptomyces sp. NPDC052043 TaxID=3365684 RepID=UPI0037CE5F6A
MAWLWVVLGIVILVAGLVDLFLTSLNYDEAGFIATPLGALQWRGLRRITRRLPRAWRPRVLRQVTGLQIAQSLVTWLVFTIVGYGLIYYGQMSGRNFQYDGRDLHGGIFAALYLSAAQLATVGTSQITPETHALRTVSILETLTSLVLISLALTFLINIFQVVRDLSKLSANLYVAPAGSDAVASLAPYFPQGQPTGIDSHLDTLNDAFSSYIDGLRLHHVAYYFQSGRDHFSLPYSLDMLSGVVAALRWGLPSGHLAAREPALSMLTLRFNRFATYLHDSLRWRSTEVPETVDFETFDRSYRGQATTEDLWLRRFLQMNHAMEELAHVDPEDPDAAYKRYQEWLPFAFRAHQVVSAVSRDLDYQPIRHPGDRGPYGVALPAGESTAEDTGGLHLITRLLVRLRHGLVVTDPGLNRLTSGLRALLAAAASVGTLYGILIGAGVGPNALPVAVLGGSVGMAASGMPRDPTLRGRRITAALMVVPAMVGATIGAAAEPSPTASIVALVVVVLIGVWVRRFGPRFIALGMLLFMACYFALLLQFPISQVAWLALATVVGTAWAYLVRFHLVPERPAKTLRLGVRTFYAKVATLLDPLVDAVSAGRWDPDLVHAVRTDLRQLRQCGAFLEGRLRATDPTAMNGTPPPSDLRLRLFDAELAAGNLAAATRRIAGEGTRVPRALRAELAGLLEGAQEQVRHQGSSMTSAGVSAAPRDSAVPERLSPEHWPEPARRVHTAVSELLSALDTTHEETEKTTDDSVTSAAEVTADTTAAGARRLDQGRLAPTSRQAIQAAVATGLALLAGTAISPGRQYWAAIAAFVVFSGTETADETIVKGIQRLIGTLIGAVIGFGVAGFTGGNPAVVLPLVAVCVFGVNYSLSFSYTWAVFWVTMMISLLYQYLGKLSPVALELRGLETLVGAVIALAAAAFLMPTRTREKVRGDLVAVLHTIDAIIDSSASILKGDSDRGTLSRHGLELDQHMHRLHNSVAPLRRAANALRRDGVERRLTALWALSYYTRHLIGAVSPPARPDTSELPTETLNQMMLISRDNISSLTRVVSGEGPGDTHDIEDTLPSERIDDLMRKPAVRDVVRINQTVVILIDDLSPGSEKVTPAQ